MTGVVMAGELAGWGVDWPVDFGVDPSTPTPVDPPRSAHGFGRFGVQKLFTFASVRVSLLLLAGSAPHNPPDPPSPPVPPSVPSPVPPPNTHGKGTKRVTTRDMLRFSARVTDRELSIIETVDLLGLVTASHIERLHFSGLTGRSRIVVRHRVMRRLIKARAVMEFRRLGGVDRNKWESIYALDSAGRWLMKQRQGLSGAWTPKRSSLPALQTLDHMLDISELYVRIIEQSRAHGFAVADFATEPASWWWDETTRSTIKPDAYAALKDKYVDHWWIEVERGSESVRTIMRQLDVYVAFRQAGRGGPAGVIPRVLVTTPSKARCKALTDALGRLDPIAQDYITITPYADAAPFLAALVATPHRPTHKHHP